MTRLEKLLTPRRLQILKHLITGDSGYVIACDLGVTEATIKAITNTIFNKLKVNNKTELAWVVCKSLIEEIANGAEFPEEKAKLFLEWMEAK